MTNEPIKYITKVSITNLWQRFDIEWNLYPDVNILAGFIRELNPNLQLIIATHSPAIIMEGWLDKVFEISDITTKDNLKVNANA